MSTPVQANNDLSADSEDCTVTICVLTNDTGASKSLYSVNQGGSAQQTIATSKFGASIQIVNGSIVYNPAGSAAIQALGAGESVTDTFTYTIKSGSTYSTATVTVTVHGTNDAPVLSADVGSHAFTEAAGITGGSAIDSYSGALTFADINLSDTHTASAKLASTSWSGHSGIPSAASAALAAALSTSVSDSTGTGHGAVNFNFALADKATDFLAAGETLTVTYNVTVSDTHGGTSTKPVVFTITGTNDAPNVTAASVDGDDDDHSSCFSLLNIWGNNSAAAASGEVNFTDPDFSDTHTASATMLAAISSSGTLSASVAADLTSAFKVKIGSDSTNGNTGTANWSYTLPASLKNLPVGQTVLVEYQVNVADGHGGVDTQPVTLLITGASGGATVTAGVATGQLSEMPGTTGSTTLDKATGAIDLSGGEVNTLSSVSSSVAFVSWSGGAGMPSAATAALNSALSLALVADGGCDRYGNAYSSSATWSFASADKNFDFLAQGETLTVVYKVVATDRSHDTVTRLVTLTIIGTNDGPVVAADIVASHGATEIAATTGSVAVDAASAALAFTDVDLKDTHVASFAAPSVTWSGGSTLPAGLSTTLAGALSLSLTDSTNTGAGSVAAKFSAADKSFDFLAKGETLTVIYNVTVTDNNGATSTKPVTFIVTGTNDTPVVAADTVASHGITELASNTGSATADTASATLAFTDVDLKDTHTASFTAPIITWSGGATLPAGLAATLATSLSLSLADSTNTGAGSVTANFSATDKSFDFLAKGETLTFTYNVTVTDNNGATSTQPVKFIVTGSNDTPVVAADTVASHAIAEIASTAGSAAADTASATLSFTDVDLKDTHTTSFAAPTVTWSGGSTLPAGLSTTLASALSLSLADSTNTGAGSVTAAFSAADSKFDFLAKGETLTVTYNVTVTDNNGATSTKPVTFVVTGTNDAPVVAADTVASHAITEIAATTGSAAADTASATLAFTDIDLKDTHTASFAAPTIAWSGGSALPSGLATSLAGALSLSVADSTNTGAGSVTAAFSAADGKFDFLAKGETLTVTYNVTVTDNNGAASTQPVKFVITGTNDTPVVAADTVASHGITEAAGTTGSTTADTASATLAFTDVDLKDTHITSFAAPAIIWSGGATVPSGLATSLGSALSLSLSDSTNTGAGSVTASFSSADCKFDFLAQGETLTVTYNVTVTDNNGASSTKPVTFVITGTNDTPVVAADTVASHAITETAATTGSTAADTASATLSFTDVDLKDTHTASFAAPAITWSGGTTLPSNLATSLASALSLSVADSTNTGAGSVTASFSSADCKFDFLAQGETLTVTYNVTVTDNNGATSTKPVTFVVTGTNDAPVVAADTVASHAITEAAATTGSAATDTASATLSFADVDLNDTHTASFAAPTVTWSGGATLPGGLAFGLGGALSLSLADSTSTGAGAVTASFSLVDKAFDFLAQGETLTMTYNVTVTDNNGAASTKPVTFVVTGTNDAPLVMTDTGTHAITEIASSTGSATADTASATLSFRDADLNDTHTVSAAAPLLALPGGGAVPAGLAASLSGALSLSLADSTGTGAGSVTANFSAADKSFDFLAVGENLRVTYVITVTDNNGASSTRAVVFVVTGTNDAPVVAADTVTHALGEVAGLTGSSLAIASFASLAFTDADLKDTHTASISAPAITWSGGATLPAGLAASMASAASVSLTDSIGSGAGQVKTNFLTTDKVFDFLAQGETLAVTYNVTVTDNNGASSTRPVTFTITGTNDGPVVAADSASHAITETAATTGSTAADTASATLSFTDVDLNDTHTAAFTAPTVTWSGGAALPGTLYSTLAGALSLSVVDSTGTGSGSVTAAFSAKDCKFDFLAQGETLTVTYNVTVTDNNGAPSTKPVTFVITGTNDAPVVAADAATHALGEIAGLTGSSQAIASFSILNFTDVDLDDTHTAVISAPAITWSGGGALPAGFAASMAAAASVSLTDSTGSGAGQVKTNFLTTDKVFDFLAQGETLTVTYNVTVTDNNGATSTKPVTFVVTGTNDAPVVAADAVSSHAITEAVATTGSAAADTASATLSFTDVDLNDTHTAAFTAPTITWSGGATLPGTLYSTLAGALSLSVVDSTGSGSGSVTAAFSAKDCKFDFLAQGETLTVTYNVTVTDNNGATSTQPVTFTVTGTNDAPVVAADAGSHAFSEAAGTGPQPGHTVSATLGFTDVDLNDSHTASVAAPVITWSGGTTLPSGLAATLGGALTTTLTDSTGSGTGSVHAAFSAGDSSFDFLAQGETLTVTYNVTVTDNNGASSTQPVTITVTGTNDAPVLAADTAKGGHAVTEAAATTGSVTADTASVTLSFTDVDLNDTHAATFAAPTIAWSGGTILPPGLASTLGSALSLSLADSTGSGAGSVTAAFSAADLKFDFLAQGETLSVTYDVTVTDNNGGTSTRPVSFTVTGTNDTPMLSADAGIHAITEVAGTTGSATADAASATLGFSDVDLNDTHAASFSAPVISWSGGTVLPGGLAATLGSALSLSLTETAGGGTIDASFSAADNTFDFLAQGETLTATYNVTVTDNNGATSTQPVSFTVTGTNDAPVMQNPGITTVNVNNQGIGSTTFNFVDADVNDTHAVSASAPVVTWSGGTLPAGLAAEAAAAMTLYLSQSDSTGSGSGSVQAAFAEADNGAFLRQLGADGNLTYKYAITVTDNHGASTTSSVVFADVHGINAAPELAADTVTSHAAAELPNVTGSTFPGSASVTLGFTDGNYFDTHTASATPTAIAWSGGSTLPSGLATALANGLSLSVADTTNGATGSVTATLSAPDSTFDFLAPGETLTITYNVTVADNYGDASTRPVTFTVTGTDDVPVLLGFDATSVRADNLLRIVTTSFTDADLNDSHTATYSAPAISAESGVSVPAGLADSVAHALSLSVTDQAGTGTGTLAATFTAPAGTFDFLNTGETVTLTYDVVLADANGADTIQPVSFTIIGTNTAPVVAADTASHAITEAAAVTGSSAVDSAVATLNFTDSGSDTHTISNTAPAVTWSGGTLSAGASSAITNALSLQLNDSHNTGTGSVVATLAAPDSTFDFLAKGETLTVTTTVTVTDNHGASNSRPVTFTVTGTNDAPVFGTNSEDPIQSFTLGETAGVTGSPASDTVAIVTHFHDADLNDTHSIAAGAPSISFSGGAVPAGLAATLAHAVSLSLADSTGTGTGAITATFSSPDNSFDFLAQGETLTVTYDVTVTDNNGAAATKPISFTVTGTNDAPVLAAQPPATTIDFATVDSVTPDYQYVIGDYQFANVGIQSNSGTDNSASLLLGGRGDSIIARGDGGEFSLQGFDIGSQYISSTATVLITAYDHGTAVGTQTVSVNPGDPFTHVTLVSSFGQVDQVTMSVSGGGHDVDILLDNMVLGSAGNSAAIIEAAGVTASSAVDNQVHALAFSDVDLSDTHTAAHGAPTLAWSGGTTPAGLDATLASALSLHVNDSTGTGHGSVSATFAAPDSTFDFLAQGETLTATYNVTVTDNHGATSTQPVTFTVTGTNDAPVLAPSDTPALAPAAPTTVTENFGFEPSDPYNNGIYDNQSGMNGVQLAGFNITGLGGSWNPYNYEGNPDGAGQSGNFEVYSAYYGGGNNGQQADIHRADGAEFALKSIDISALQPYYNGQGDVTFVGYDHGVQVASLDVTNLTDPYANTTDYQTVTFGAEWSHVDDVQLYINGTYVEEIDNIVVVAPAATSGDNIGFESSDTVANTPDPVTGANGFTDNGFSFGGASIDTSDYFGNPNGPGQAGGAWVFGFQTVASGANVEIQRTDGSEFALKAIDIGAYYPAYYGASQVTFVGYDHGAQVASQTVSSPGNSYYGIDYQTVTFGAAWSQVNDVRIYLNGNPYDLIDNLVTDTGNGTGGPVGTLTETAGVTGSSAVDSVTGTLHFTDADLSDTHVASAGNPAIVVSGGTALPDGVADALAAGLSLAVTDSTGTGAGSIAITQAVADGTYDFLAEGQTLTVTYQITVTDNNGASSTQPATFVITGTNDAPVIAADTTAPYAINEFPGITGGNFVDRAVAVLNFTDVDLADTHTIASGTPTLVWSGGTAPVGLANTLAGDLYLSLADSTDSGTGSITARFFGTDSNFDFLAQGETLAITYNVTVTDNNGATSTQPVTFTVTGANDQPGLNTGSTSFNEASGTSGSSSNDTVTATLTFGDVDLNDTHTASYAAPTITWSGGATLPSGLATTLGSALAVSVTDGSGNGSVAAKLTAADRTFDFLAQGETLTIRYPVTIADNNGATYTSLATFTITGTNDAPVLAADTGSHAVTEATGTTGSSTADTASATLSFADVDLKDTHTASGGTPTLVWSGGTAPAGLASALASALSFSVTDSTNSGAGSLTANFSAADSKFDFLAKGETLAITYNVTVTDNNGATSTKPVTLTVTGTNDAPVLSAGSASFNETSNATGSSSNDTATASLGFSDVDLKDTHTASFAAPTITWSGGAILPSGLATTLGNALALTVTDSTNSGSGSVAAKLTAPDSSFDFLAQGETLTVAYNVTVTDNNGATSTKVATFTITGTNDAPVLAADTTSSHAITEAAGTTGSATADTATASLSFTDADLKDTHTASFAAPTITWSAAGSLPSGLSTALASALSLTTSDATGTVTANFSAADSKFDFLAKNETLTITYNVTVSDNHGGTSVKPVVFVVTGTNDAPVVSGTISASLNTNSSAAAVNALQNASDTDTHDTLSVVNLPGTLPDGVTYNATNHTFTMDPTNATYQTLGQGQSTIVTVNYGVSDGTTTTADSISWTITGVNHAPTALSVSNSTVAENLPGIAIGTLVGVDPDSGSVLTYAINSGLDGALFAIVGNVLSVGSNGLIAAQTPNPQVSVRVTDQYGAFKDVTLGLHVQAETQVGLTNGTDNVTGIAANTQVYGAYTALNNADQIQGAGDTALVLYGVGTANLNNLAKFQGFSQVDLINYASGTSALTLKTGQDMDVKTSGTGAISINTSTGHATIESTSNGTTTLVGSSGQVDASVAAANLTVTGGTGAMTIVNNAAYGSNTITGGVGNLSYTQASGQTYNEQITGGSGTLTVDLSHAFTYQESITAGTGAVNYKSGNGYYNANFYVNSDANWHNGNVVDFTADNNNNSNFQFSGSGSSTIDLTQSSIIHAYQLNLNNDTFLINSATVASAQYVYGTSTIQTAAATLNLSTLQGSNTLFGSTNATGTTFTVTNKTIGFDVVGGAGQDTLVASGFAYSSDERNAIFATTSVETIKDTSGTYTAIADPNVTKLTGATDTLNLTAAGQTVNGTSVTLNNADSLTGHGDTKLAIYGAGTFNLNNLAHYTGFSEVDLNDYFSNAIALTLKTGQDTIVKVNGTAGTTITTSTGHATIQDSSQGSLTLNGSSGQVDATLDTSSLTLTGGAGTMTVADRSEGTNSINVTAGTGILNFTETGSSYQGTFSGGSGGAMTIDNSGAQTYIENITAGAGVLTYKSGTAYYGASVTVNGDGNWHAGDSVDFTANTGNNSSFNFYGSGGTTIDLTATTLKNVYGFQLYYDTFKVNSATLAHASYVYGNTVIQTADTTLNLSSLTNSNTTFASTNATGTTFTVANSAIGFDVVGGAGQDKLVASGFAYNAAQRAEIFATTSVETIQDTSGTYTAVNDPTVTALTAANDTVSVANAGMSVSGTSTTLTNGDSLTGHGDTKLVVYGGDTLNLNSLAHFSGFSEVDVVNYTANTTTLTLKTGQAMAVNVSGPQSLVVTTADAHATLTTSGVNSMTLTGASGLVDATLDTTSLTLNVGTGTMNVADHSNNYSSININGSSGTLAFTQTGLSYQDSFSGSSGAMSINNSGATTYTENFTAGSGLMTYKSGTGYYGATFTVNGDANWHAGDSVDFTADTSNNGTFTFNGTGGGATVDLTTASLVHVAQLNLYNDTFLISSATVASVTSINANLTLETAGSSLNLTAVNSASAQFGSTNATGTTFTVANTAVAFDVLGGSGTDTLVGQGFAFSSDQRAEVFTTTSVEIVQDTSGTYGNNAGQSLTARTAGDKVVGGTGNDSLISGVGNDTLTGGAGADTFVFSSVHAGKDTITDFTSGADFLQFDHTIFADAATAFSHAAQSGSDVVITIDGSDTVTLKGFLMSNLHTSDFHIV